MKYMMSLSALILLVSCACPQEWASGPGYCKRAKLAAKHQEQKKAYYAAESPMQKAKRIEDSKFCAKEWDKQPERIDKKWDDAANFFDECMQKRGSPRFK